MVTFSTQHLRDLVKKSPATSDDVDKIDFLEFSDAEAAVKSDVQWLKEEPLVLPETTISGWIYEVETGKVRMSFLHDEAHVAE
jgi:carbonic anhydrase